MQHLNCFPRRLKVPSSYFEASLNPFSAFPAESPSHAGKPLFIETGAFYDRSNLRLDLLNTDPPVTVSEMKVEWVQQAYNRTELVRVWRESS